MRIQGLYRGHDCHTKVRSVFFDVLFGIDGHGDAGGGGGGGGTCSVCYLVVNKSGNETNVNAQRRGAIVH